jgi:hypothetical protein
MKQQVEHWFNRRWGIARRDVYLLQTPAGWQILGCEGGSGGREVTHYFDREDDARLMLQRMLNTVAPQLRDWRQITTGGSTSPELR